MSKKSTKTYGFAIVGCGLIADFHAKAIDALPNAKLVMTASRRAKNAKRVAEPYQADWTTNWRDVLKRDDVDIVNVCTPSGAHMPYALAAARAGKHVVVEKPLEITLARCDRIIEAADEAGVKLVTIFPSRFGHAAQAIKKAIDQGRLGRIVLADAYVKWYRNQAYYAPSRWQGTKRWDGGGALMNQSIHTIDLLQWFVGPVKSVMGHIGRLGHQGIEVEDAAVAALEFRNGAFGTVEGTTAAYKGYPRRVEICGTKGSVFLEGGDITVWNFTRERRQDKAIRRKFGKKEAGAGGASDPAAISHVGHQRQLRDVLKALDTGTEVFCDGREGRLAVEIILAIYRSSHRRRRVTLPLK
ncbi:MAG: Gfo/Idh/MocA family oxidoreductase [Planctomycetes bacterium]|nr:Gfo/Idh/MocA family oxidoreductase [Planctomycetota bacterium]